MLWILYSKPILVSNYNTNLIIIRSCKKYLNVTPIITNVKEEKNLVSPVKRNQVFEQKVSETNIPSLKNNLYKVYWFYENVSGLNEVKAAQNKVLFLQDRLADAQERRRQLIYELSFIRKELQQLHNDIMSCERGQPRYLDLIRKEIDVIQREKEKTEHFNIADAEEREIFTNLTAAVKMSHEKERLQAETVKYWSIIGSILGALLGVFVALLTNHYRNDQMLSIKKQSNGINDKIDSLNSMVSKLNELVGSKPQERKETESWGGYFYRHTAAVYRYFIPK